MYRGSSEYYGCYYEAWSFVELLNSIADDVGSVIIEPHNVNIEQDGEGLWRAWVFCVRR